MIRNLMIVLAATSMSLAACAPAETSETAAVESAVPEAATQTNIVEAAVASGNFTTLVAAVQAAGLVDTLSGAGPFTVFAPTDAAFAKLPEGTVATLTQPANQATLAGILTYHVVAGRVSAADLISQINAGGGTATLTTVQGQALTASLSGANVILTDAAGGRSTVSTADLMQSNGVIHVIDTVLMPAQG